MASSTNFVARPQPLPEEAPAQFADYLPRVKLTARKSTHSDLKRRSYLLGIRGKLKPVDLGDHSPNGVQNSFHCSTLRLPSDAISLLDGAVKRINIPANSPIAGPPMLSAFSKSQNGFQERSIDSKPEEKVVPCSVPSRKCETARKSFPDCRNLLKSFTNHPAFRDRESTCSNHQNGAGTFDPEPRKVYICTKQTLCQKTHQKATINSLNRCLRIVPPNVVDSRTIPLVIIDSSIKTVQNGNFRNSSAVLYLNEEESLLFEKPDRFKLVDSTSQCCHSERSPSPAPEKLDSPDPFTKSPELPPILQEEMWPEPPGLSPQDEMEDYNDVAIEMPPLLLPTDIKKELEDRETSRSPEMPVLLPVDMENGDIEKSFFELGVRPVSEVHPLFSLSGRYQRRPRRRGVLLGFTRQCPNRTTRTEAYFQGRYAFMAGKKIRDPNYKRGMGPVKRPGSGRRRGRPPLLGIRTLRRAGGRGRGRPRVYRSRYSESSLDTMQRNPHIDVVDGVEFLSFETELDLECFMKTHPSYTLDVSKLRDVDLELLKFPLDCKQSLGDAIFLSSSSKRLRVRGEPIVLTKTKDITKIKGWRNKVFANGQNSTTLRGAKDYEVAESKLQLKVEKIEKDEKGVEPGATTANEKGDEEKTLLQVPSSDIAETRTNSESSPPAAKEPVVSAKDTKSAFVSDYLDEFLRKNSQLKIGAAATLSNEFKQKNGAEIDTKVVWPTKDDYSLPAPLPPFGDNYPFVLAPPAKVKRMPGRPRKNASVRVQEAERVKRKYTRRAPLKNSGHTEVQEAERVKRKYTRRAPLKGSSTEVKQVTPIEMPVLQKPNLETPSYLKTNKTAASATVQTAPMNKVTIDPVAMSFTDAQFAASAVLSAALLRNPADSLSPLEEIGRMCKVMKEKPEVARARERMCRKFSVVIDQKHVARALKALKISVCARPAAKSPDSPDFLSTEFHNLSAEEKWEKMMNCPIDGDPFSILKDLKTEDATGNARSILSSRAADKAAGLAGNSAASKGSSPTFASEAPSIARKEPAIAGSRCAEPYCQLGCICSSLKAVKKRRRHCGKTQCMLSCICKETEALQARVEEDDPKQKLLDVPAKRRREIRMPARLKDSVCMWNQAWSSKDSLNDEDFSPTTPTKKRGKYNTKKQRELNSRLEALAANKDDKKAEIYNLASLSSQTARKQFITKQTMETMSRCRNDKARKEFISARLTDPAPSKIGTGARKSIGGGWNKTSILEPLKRTTDQPPVIVLPKSHADRPIPNQGHLPVVRPQSRLLYDLEGRVAGVVRHRSILPAPRPRASKRGPPTFTESKLANRGPSTCSEPKLANRGISASTESKLVSRGISISSNSKLANRGPSISSESKLANRGPSTSSESKLANRDPPPLTPSMSAKLGPSASTESVAGSQLRKTARKSVSAPLPWATSQRTLLDQLHSTRKALEAQKSSSDDIVREVVKDLINKASLNAELDNALARHRGNQPKSSRARMSWRRPPMLQPTPKPQDTVKTTTEASASHKDPKNGVGRVGRGHIESQRRTVLREGLRRLSSMLEPTGRVCEVKGEPRICYYALNMAREAIGQLRCDERDLVETKRGLVKQRQELFKKYAKMTKTMGQERRKEEIEDLADGMQTLANRRATKGPLTLDMLNRSTMPSGLSFSTIGREAMDAECYKKWLTDEFAADANDSDLSGSDSGTADDRVPHALPLTDSNKNYLKQEASGKSDPQQQRKISTDEWPKALAEIWSANPEQNSETAVMKTIRLRPTGSGPTWIPLHESGARWNTGKVKIGRNLPDKAIGPQASLMSNFKLCALKTAGPNTAKTDETRRAAIFAVPRILQRGKSLAKPRSGANSAASSKSKAVPKIAPLKRVLIPVTVSSSLPFQAVGKVVPLSIPSTEPIVLPVPQGGALLSKPVIDSSSSVSQQVATSGPIGSNALSNQTKKGGDHAASSNPDNYNSQTRTYKTVTVSDSILKKCTPVQPASSNKIAVMPAKSAPEKSPQILKGGILRPNIGVGGSGTLNANLGAIPIRGPFSKLPHSNVAANGPAVVAARLPNILPNVANLNPNSVRAYATTQNVIGINGKNIPLFCTLPKSNAMGVPVTLPSLMNPNQKNDPAATTTLLIGVIPSSTCSNQSGVGTITTSSTTKTRHPGSSDKLTPIMAISLPTSATSITLDGKKVCFLKTGNRIVPMMNAPVSLAARTVAAVTTPSGVMTTSAASLTAKTTTASSSTAKSPIVATMATVASPTVTVTSSIPTTKYVSTVASSAIAAGPRPSLRPGLPLEKFKFVTTILRHPPTPGMISDPQVLKEMLEIKLNETPRNAAVECSVWQENNGSGACELAKPAVGTQDRVDLPTELTVMTTPNPLNQNVETQEETSRTNLEQSVSPGQITGADESQGEKNLDLERVSANPEMQVFQIVKPSQTIAKAPEIRVVQKPFVPVPPVQYPIIPESPVPNPFVIKKNAQSTPVNPPGSPSDAGVGEENLDEQGSELNQSFSSTEEIEYDGRSSPDIVVLESNEPLGNCRDQSRKTAASSAVPEMLDHHQKLLASLKELTVVRLPPKMPNPPAEHSEVAVEVTISSSEGEDAPVESDGSMATSAQPEAEDWPKIVACNSISEDEFLWEQVVGNDNEAIVDEEVEYPMMDAQMTP